MITDRPNVNQYGLSRYAPAPTRRAVRRECGFGCVICGCGIYDYEHFDPDFADAREHKVSGIALLCGTCHIYVTRGRWSKGRVAAARQSPKCLKQGYTRFEQEGFNPNAEFVISLGRCDFIKPQIVLRIYRSELLQILPPEDIGAPMRISGDFYDMDGTLSFFVRDNEYFGKLENWDIELKGTQTIVRSAAGKVTLRLRQSAQNHVIIEKLAMRYKDIDVRATTQGIRIFRASDDVDVLFDGVITRAQCCLEVSLDEQKEVSRHVQFE